MLAAIPLRRIKSEGKQSLIASVYPDIARQDIAGFTLIEMSIVLVIIGLIVGGVLVGRDLISAAAIRAQITQIEKYQTAVNTFRIKYSSLPGDLPTTTATQFGFNITNCDGTQGRRDGNGLLDGNTAPANYSQTQGETALFWQDLSTSLLIGDLIPNNGGSAVTCFGIHVLTMTPGASFVGDYFPAAKIGQNNFIYVYENNGSNWFGLLGINGTDTSGSIITSGVNAPLSVMQALKIDSKIDDGLPVTGNVTAYAVYNAQQVLQINAAISDTANSCFHNWVNSIYIPGYSITYNNGTGMNCALSFRFQ